MGSGSRGGDRLSSISGDELDARIQAALELARVGQYDGAHHKTWVIDQMVRALTGSDYEAWVLAYEDMDDGFDNEEGYHWDTGIAP